MRRTWRATACGAAALLAMSMTGCAAGEEGGPPATSASASVSGKGGQGFGRTAAQADIDAATSAAGLPASGRPEPLPSVTPATDTATATEKDRLKARAAACSAHWMIAGPEVLEGGDPRGKFDAAVAALVERGWRVTTDRSEDEVGKEGSVVGITLKKSGWSLLGRHVTGGLDMVSFQATEDACMNKFTEAEWTLMLSAGE
ncbi:hypothetical protein M5362_07240 [Streptomyces sp. Je 1-79]|uniref:hypothetical protein n=1 Tax=Streptomyces sp. Je 1-79 TaxID=2943847 RepID=UPI0021A6FF4E|nr:hypothetical protein [Streptomyces sp. Je 1-79]MCT4352922.1 hypothetical protein [Streptomyces sp. Je 1-79]